MRTCVTRSLALLAALALVGAARGSAATERRTEIVFGASLYDLDSPFDDDNLTGFFDQYRHIATKNAEIPYFADLLALDVGLVREDETYLARLQRRSPWAWNDRADLDVRWKELRLESSYHRYRKEDLRLFPVGTREGGGVVFAPPCCLGTDFNDDVPEDSRLFLRRTGADGELRYRLSGPEEVPGALSELRLLSAFEHRSGYRQSRFALDAAEVGSGAQNARFRAFRQELDQDVTTVGAGFTGVPLGLFTAALDARFEAFRNDADTVTLARLRQLDPVGIQPPASEELNAFDFLPSTDRLSASLRLSRRIEEATVHAGGFLTFLDQVDSRAPLQKVFDLDTNYVATYTLHAAADVPLGRLLGVNGFVKFLSRHNGLETDTDLFRDDNATQVGPLIEDRREWRTGGELALTPAPGALVAGGYRGAFTRRSLAYADPVLVGGTPTNPAILPAFALIDDDSDSHTFYLRSHARLLRSLRVSGEVGALWAPSVSYPRELESGYYLKGGSSFALSRPLASSVALFGSLVDGENDDFTLLGATPGVSERKRFERREWRYGASWTAAPSGRITLFSSVWRQGDEQRFDHVRSNLPRFFGQPALQFFLDSSPDYSAEVFTLLAGTTCGLTRTLDLTLATSVTRSEVRFSEAGATADILEEVNRIDHTITSFEAAVGYEPRANLRLELGYRLDRYSDRAEVELPDLDTDEHTFTLAVRIGTGLPASP